MIVHIQFDSQIRRLAECSGTSIEVDESTSLKQVIQRVAAQGTESLRTALVDEMQTPRASLLVFMNNELVTPNRSVVWQDGSEVIFTTLISGG